MMQENGISLFYAKSSRHRRIAAFILWVGKQNFFFHSLRSHVAQGKETEKEKKSSNQGKYYLGNFYLVKSRWGICSAQRMDASGALACAQRLSSLGEFCAAQVGLGLTK